MDGDKAEIIRRASAGDFEAFRLIHEEYSRRIFNFVYRMVDSREDAEDISQNAFLRAFHEIGRLQDAGRFESWLYRIARNEVYQKFRKKRSEPPTRDASVAGRDGEPQKYELADQGPTPQDNILNEELGTAIRSVLALLPTKQREVFVLAVMDKKSYAEISDIVGRSLLSVKTDIFRARRFARKSLKRYLEIGSSFGSKK